MIEGEFLKKGQSYNIRVEVKIRRLDESLINGIWKFKF